MTEKLLQYVWRTLLFDVRNLMTNAGAKLVIVRPGQWNQAQGPDFLNAEILLDGLRLCGHIEMHCTGKDWFAHGHQLDEAYNNVILHVVYNSDGKQVERQDGTTIPELELGPHIHPNVLEYYELFDNSKQELACAHILNFPPKLHIQSWLRTKCLERYEARCHAILASRAQWGDDWRQMFWVELCGAFGVHLNKEPFRQLAAGLPAACLHKHAEDSEALEALLFGAAGFLEMPDPEPYPNQLADLWRHLAHKYALSPMPPGQFKFGGNRPANFPTVRLAQLAALWRQHHDLFILLDEPLKFMEVAPRLTVSEYWRTHYRFGKAGASTTKFPGTKFALGVCLNAVIPYAMAYADATGNHERKIMLFEFLEQLPPEENKIVDLFNNKTRTMTSAMMSQGAKQLFDSLCQDKKCFECAIGAYIIKHAR